MARQIIDVTTQNPGWIGDLAKIAFTKTNDNFAELYAGFDRTVGIMGKNRLLNGDFRIAQRGVSFPFAATARYGVDRWFLWGAGSQIGGNQQNADGTALPASMQDRPRNAFQVSVNSVAGNSNFALLQQRLEDVRTLAGGKATFSGWMWSDAAKTISVGMYQLFGTNGSATTKINSQKVSLPSQQWTYVALTFDVPSVAGKTIATADSTLWLNIWLDAGINSDGAADAGGIGQKSGIYWFSQLQLEAGPTATSFEIRPFALELAACQRFYQKSYMHSDPPATFTNAGRMTCGNGGTTNNINRVSVQFRVTMRAPPSIIIYGAPSGTPGYVSQADGSNITGIIEAIGDSSFNAGWNNNNGQWGGWWHWTADAEL
ncbi:hypothetical protein MOQ14_14410 [Stenotrophomonas maltophilia]|uniref:hypothetical protein n=1 Tax=Stenotrophomonas maltophilia TaxID=40324 RepID=UPI001F531B1C|nr:hypothetical protein [Stenotrophomonas maltophilia]MCI1139766.1 hypothetical protein [Stenotrophomonas maltophilia]